MITLTPSPPYYAVIFSSIQKSETDGYEETAKRMAQLASNQEGFLGMESVRNELGITISYWKDLESIQKWKENSAHLEAQKLGKSKWYQQYRVRICKVEKEYGFDISSAH